MIILRYNLLHTKETDDCVLITYFFFKLSIGSFEVRYIFLRNDLHSPAMVISYEKGVGGFFKHILGFAFSEGYKNRNLLPHEMESDFI